MIPVFWMAEQNDRGRYNSTHQFNEMLDGYQCTHYGIENVPENLEGAVVVVHGGRMLGISPKFVSEMIESLKWVVLVHLGDEESSFPSEQVEHPNMIAWVQEPLPGRHDFAKRKMIDGYPHYARKHIFECFEEGTQKDLDFAFHGQVTHERRFQAVEAMLKIPWGGIVVCTKGYTQGIPQKEYFRLYCRAKIAPCPSGPCSPDTARIWEALEARCIPVLDDLSPTRKEPGFWKYVLGHHPLPVAERWDWLPTAMPNLLAAYDTNQGRAIADWWRGYKDAFRYWLREDLQQLGVKA